MVGWEVIVLDHHLGGVFLFDKLSGSRDLKGVCYAARVQCVWRKKEVRIVYNIVSEKRITMLITETRR